MAYRVYYQGTYPQPKRKYCPAEFEKRQQARQWCRNRVSWMKGLTIVHPDGTEEKFN